MAFTDEDLKRNKEIAERWIKQETLGLISFKPSEMLALLARMEAAEKVCEQMWSTFDLRYLEDWRKAAGKGE
jgi:hypothetical protein